MIRGFRLLGIEKDDALGVDVDVTRRPAHGTETRVGQRPLGCLGDNRDVPRSGGTVERGFRQEETELWRQKHADPRLHRPDARLAEQRQPQILEPDGRELLFLVRRGDIDDLVPHFLRSVVPGRGRRGHHETRAAEAKRSAFSFSSSSSLAVFLSANFRGGPWSGIVPGHTAAGTAAGPMSD